MTPCNSPTKPPPQEAKKISARIGHRCSQLPGPGLSWQTSSVEVARSGDLAYETGTYDFVSTDKKGKSNDEKGKFVVVWKKQSDGSWKVVVDIDNPDQ